MIQLTPQSKIMVALRPIDFRNGIDGLKRICREVLQSQPESGILFLFKNKRGDCIKILVFDGQGYWVMMKRLSKGRFPWWPEGGAPSSHLDYRKVQLILNAAKEAEFGDDWKKLF